MKFEINIFEEIVLMLYMNLCFINSALQVWVGCGAIW